MNVLMHSFESCCLLYNIFLKQDTLSYSFNLIC